MGWAEPLSFCPPESHCDCALAAFSQSRAMRLRAISLLRHEPEASDEVTIAASCWCVNLNRYTRAN
jgi:hypothetical protein